MNELEWSIVIAIAFIAVAILVMLLSGDEPSPRAEPDCEKAWRETQEDMAAQERMTGKMDAARRRDEDEDDR